MPRTSLTTFITAVNAAISRLTDGVIGLDNLVDFADGEYSLSELWEAEFTPAEAARQILTANGYDPY